MENFSQSAKAMEAWQRGQELGYPAKTERMGNRPLALKLACGHIIRRDLSPEQMIAIDDKEIDRLCAQKCLKCRNREANEAHTNHRKKAQDYHDKLYGEAMRLSADADDMDVVEHYCQGHIDRLKKFIEAREK